jgi:hypothetical protein
MAESSFIQKISMMLKNQIIPSCVASWFSSDGHQTPPGCLNSGPISRSIRTAGAEGFHLHEIELWRDGPVSTTCRASFGDGGFSATILSMMTQAMMIILNW